MIRIVRASDGARLVLQEVTKVYGMLARDADATHNDCIDVFEVCGCDADNFIQLSVTVAAVRCLVTSNGFGGGTWGVYVAGRIDEKFTVDAESYLRTPDALFLAVANNGAARKEYTTSVMCTGDCVKAEFLGGLK